MPIAKAQAGPATGVQRAVAPFSHRREELHSDGSSVRALRLDDFNDSLVRRRNRALYGVRQFLKRPSRPRENGVASEAENDPTKKQKREECEMRQAEKKEGEDAHSHRIRHGLKNRDRFGPRTEGPTVRC